MATIRDFYTYIHDDLHNAPRFVVEKATLAIVVEFLERTLIWQETTNAISISADTYEHTPTWGATLPYKYASIVRAYTADGTPLDVASEDILYRKLGNRWPNETSTQIRSVVSLYNNNIGVYPLSSSATHQDIYLVTPVTITRSTTEIPDWLFDSYVEAISAGVKAKVLGQFNKSWSAPSYSRKFRVEYTRMVRKVRNQTIRGKGEVSATVAPQSFKYLGGR